MKSGRPNSKLGARLIQKVQHRARLRFRFGSGLHPRAEQAFLLLLRRLAHRVPRLDLIHAGRRSADGIGRIVIRPGGERSRGFRPGVFRAGVHLVPRRRLARRADGFDEVEADHGLSDDKLQPPLAGANQLIGLRADEEGTLSLDLNGFKFGIFQPSSARDRAGEETIDSPNRANRQTSRSSDGISSFKSGAECYPGAKTATLQHAAYPDLAPLKLGLKPEDAFAQALSVAQAKGWTIVASVPAEGRIEATTSSLLYGFTDEVIVRVKAAEGRALVDVSSVSALVVSTGA